MREKVDQLKLTVQTLEQHIVAMDTEGFEEDMRKIEELCRFIRIDFNHSVEYNKQAPGTNEPVEDLKYETINTLAFLYKPTRRENVYEGNYLEHFAEERTEQLMHARAINQHNEFWKQHETIHGNVYASVPVELIQKESVEALERMGWDHVSVNVIDFGVQAVEKRELIRICEESFPKYILLREATTDSYIVLEYVI